MSSRPKSSPEPSSLPPLPPLLSLSLPSPLPLTTSPSADETLRRLRLRRSLALPISAITLARSDSHFKSLQMQREEKAVSAPAAWTSSRPFRDAVVSRHVIVAPSQSDFNPLSFSFFNFSLFPIGRAAFKFKAKASFKFHSWCAHE